MNELEALAEKQQQEKLQQQAREQRQAQLRQQLFNMEQQSVITDQTQREAFRENALTHMKSYEASITSEMNAQAQQVDVNAAPSDDSQPAEAPAASETWKEKRARVKREKQATADIHNYLASSSLNISPEINAMAVERKIDVRVVSNFAQPFQLDRYGKPATPADEEILRRNKALAKDYVMGNELARKARFNEMLSKVLNMELTPHMLDDHQYVLENAQKFAQMGTELTSMESLINDNKAFYEALSPEIRKKLEEKTDLMGELGTAISEVFQAGGINSGSGSYWGDKDDAEENRQTAREDFKLWNGQYHDKCLNMHLEQEARSYYAEEAKTERQRYYMEKYGTFFENGAGDYQYEKLKRVRDAIAKDPDRYAENKEQLDELYQRFYRALESSGELMNKFNLYQSVVVNHQESRERDDVELTELANEKAEKMTDDYELVDKYADALGEAIICMTTGEEATAEAQKVLADYYEEKRQAHWTKVSDEQKARAEAERQAEAEKQERERLAAEKKAEEAEKLRFEQERVAGWEAAEKLRSEKERIASEKKLVSDRDREARKLQVWGGTMDEKQAQRASLAAWQRLRGKAPVAEEEAPVKPYETETAQWKLPKHWQESAQNGVDYMKNIIKCKELSFPPEYKTHRADLKFDHRNPFFIKEFKLNEKGEPAGDEDRKIVEENLKNFRAYAAGDPAVRKPMLDELISKYRNINLRPDEFDDSTQLLKDIPYYYRIAQLQLDVTTAEKDNPAYFAQMEPALKEEFLRKKAFLTSFGMNYLINYALSMNGLDLYHRTLCEDEDTIKTFVPSYYERLEKAHRQIPLYNTEKQADRIYKEKRAGFAETDKSRRKHYGVSFPNGAGVEQYREMRDLRKMIATNPEAYAAQRELVDAMFKKLYAGNAMLGENEFRIHANQDIAEGRAEAPEDGVDEETRVRCAAEAMEKLRQEQSDLKGYDAGIRELLSSLLEGKPLSEAASMVLAAYNAELRQPDLERAAKEQKADRK